MPLRPARWSDATAPPITAADVVYTVQTEMNPTLDGSAHFDWSNVSSVTAADDYTVVFKLKRRDGAFLGDNLVMAVVPSHALHETNPSGMAEALFSTQPNSAGGPFQLEIRNPGQGLALARNKHYYGPQPYLDGVQMEVLSDPSVLSDRLGQGSINWAPDISTAEEKALSGLPNVTVRRIPQLGRFALVFNERGGRPFAGQAVRVALAGALDRNRVAAAAGGVAVCSGVSPASWAYVSTCPAPSGAAPEAAGKLLYPLGDAARARAAAELAREAPGLAPTAVPPGEFEARLHSGDFDVALAGLGEGVDPDPAPAAASWGAQNFGAYSDPAVDSLIAQDLALDPSDHAARRRTLDAVQAQLLQDPPYVDLWTVDEVDAFSGSLVGVGTAGPQLDQDLQSSFYARWSLSA